MVSIESLVTLNPGVPSELHACPRFVGQEVAASEETRKPRDLHAATSRVASLARLGLHERSAVNVASLSSENRGLSNGTTRFGTFDEILCNARSGPGSLCRLDFAQRGAHSVQFYLHPTHPRHRFSVRTRISSKPTAPVGNRADAPTCWAQQPIYSRTATIKARHNSLQARVAQDRGFPVCPATAVRAVSPHCFCQHILGQAWRARVMPETSYERT